MEEFKKKGKILFHVQKNIGIFMKGKEFVMWILTRMEFEK